MLKDIIIKNYRCFSSLHLKDLARVNLIAGKNNTGKTALLEAIYLHSRPNDIKLVATMSRYRGVLDEETPDAKVAGWLFTDQQHGSSIEITSHDDEGIARILTIWMGDATAMREKYPEAEEILQKNFGPAMNAAAVPRIVMNYRTAKEPPLFSVGTIGGSFAASMAWSSAPIPWNVPSAFIGAGVSNPKQDLAFFGTVELTKAQDDIIPALRLVEPRLQRLAIVPLGEQSIIHGDIGLDRLVPVPFMGEGTRRLLSLLLAMANAKGGMVLIDEIESGFHYSVQQQVWEAIAAAAQQNDVQVFATTHSWECIKAAHAAFSAGKKYDFRLFRLERVEGEIRAVGYTKRTLATSVEMNMEVR